MRTVSTAFAAKIASGAPLLWRITIGSATYGNGQIITDSIIYRAGVMPAGRFEPGGAVISSLSFSLRDPGGAISIVEGDAVTVEVGYLIDGTAQYIPYASMVVSEVSPTDNAISVRCLDRLSLLDEAELTITYPTTVLAMVQAAISGSGITLASTSFDGASLSIRNPGDNFAGMTKRQALSYCMQMTGQYCRIDSTGRLVIGWFDSSAAASVGAIFSRSCTTGSSYTGARVAKNGQADIDTSLIGSEGVVYVVKGNPLISGVNVSTVKTLVWGALNGLWFASGRMSILSDPRLEPGDMLEANVFRDETKFFPVTQLTLKGTTQCQVECDAAENCLLTDTRQRETETVDSEAYQLAEAAYELAQQGGANGLPPGGTAGQVLTKNSAVDYDASWQTPSGGGGGGAANIVFINESDFPPSTTYAEGTLIIVLDG